VFVSIPLAEPAECSTMQAMRSRTFVRSYCRKLSVIHGQEVSCHFLA